MEVREIVCEQKVTIDNCPQWYDPEAITTSNGSLVITLSRKETHELHYEGGTVSCSKHYSGI